MSPIAARDPWYMGWPVCSISPALINNQRMRDDFDDTPPKKLHQATSEELTFVVIIPAWEDAPGWKRLRDSRFLSKHFKLDQKGTALRNTYLRVGESFSYNDFLYSRFPHVTLDKDGTVMCDFTVWANDFSFQSTHTHTHRF